MLRLILAVAFMAVSSGCSHASDNVFDSSNPVNCLAAMSAGANSAQQASNAAAYNELFRRISLLAERNGGVEWLNKVAPQAQEIATKIEAKKDEKATAKLIAECFAKTEG